MTEQLLAWYDSQPLKDEVMDRLRKHRADDSIVQGIYQQLDPEFASGYRGCAIGCTLPPQPAFADGDSATKDPESGWKGEVEHLYGIDWNVACLIEDVFEALPPADCAAFAVDVIDAIPVGADLWIVAEWAYERLGVGTTDAAAAAAELIERLRNAPVPTPA